MLLKRCILGMGIILPRFSYLCHILPICPRPVNEVNKVKERGEGDISISHSK